MIPPTMRAVRLTGHGDYDKLDYREDIPVPTPHDNEVLIRVGAAGVNNTDINTRIGWYANGDDAGWTGAATVFPRIQGADACGRIVAVGAGVDPARIGERVLIEPVFRAPLGWAPYQALYFGSECDGAFAEYATAPAAHAHRIASPLSDAELATSPCSYSAAENMLTKADLRAGETVLITGASGGVGSAAVQLAARRGATVVAIAGATKQAEVARLGAASVQARDADLVASLGREAVDVVIDVVGGPQFPALLDVLKRGGRYAVAGAIAGPRVSLDLRTLYLKDLRLLGCTILEPGVFANLVSYIERGDLRPLLAATYPLQDIVAAQRAFLEKRHTGKIVLIP